jgi:anthraniloyl-CoA monooxygenase
VVKGNQVPKAMDRADMDRCATSSSAQPEMAARAGFDMIELHAAHGYLISSFISPEIEHSHDEYGGSLENRMRYPLEVFRAMRAAWPADKPMSVRISANDWVGDEGVTPEEAVEIAGCLPRRRGRYHRRVAGQTSTDARRSMAGCSRRRSATASATRPACDDGGRQHHRGGSGELDPAGGARRSGGLARPHLADPYWTLHAAIEMGDSALLAAALSEWPRSGAAAAARAQEVIRV